MDILSQDIMYLPGVGPQRKELLKKELEVSTWGGLLEYYPYKYVDRSRIYAISELTSDMPFVQIKGRILSFEEFEMGPRKKRVVAHFTDDHGVMDLVWFSGTQYVYKNYKVGVEYIVFGRPSVYGGRYQIAHPDIDLAKELQLSEMGMQPYYITTERMKKAGMSSRNIERLVKTMLQKIATPLPETLPPFIVERLHLMSRDEAMRCVHYPRNAMDMQKARERLKFEELFYVQLNILRYASDHRRKYRGYVLNKVGQEFNDFYANNLKFELTGAQKRVMHEIRDDMRSGRQMNRLLQGDVGSGKTLVALMTILIALGNGYQACIMAPTEILAEQHLATIREFLDGMDIRTELLTGMVKGKQRTKVLDGLISGDVRILVGTHAILEDPVRFQRLGVAVIDEQHRFGVEQRSRLWAKSAIPPHILVMTATPIPRTLAMTLYGDLDVSVIDEMPPGRVPVKTVQIVERQRLELYRFMKEQIAAGRQAFIVYPMIFENEKVDYRNVETGYEEIVQAFPFPPYKVAIVHGQQSDEDKKFNMDAFAAGRADILVSTTVIEVGVDVPNANVMVIESPERFGLSQLHQLRGRVGRGGGASWCVLVRGNKLSEESRKRLDLLCSTEDGFVLAEEDMKMRGPGDMEGTQQSGLPIELSIASLARDGRLLAEARAYAEVVLERDPELSLPQNARLMAELRKGKYDRKDYGKIS